jgi:hypothetical protein
LKPAQERQLNAETFGAIAVTEDRCGALPAHTLPPAANGSSSAPVRGTKWLKCVLLYSRVCGGFLICSSIAGGTGVRGAIIIGVAAAPVLVLEGVGAGPAVMVPAQGSSRIRISCAPAVLAGANSVVVAVVTLDVVAAVRAGGGVAAELEAAAAALEVVVVAVGHPPLELIAKHQPIISFLINYFSIIALA